ncbi:MAG: hypothetical protein LBH22_02335 [Bacteroidales bacterium]|jgi:hypothetical protein|nr:hypothetical protein [Bacteroidales bacterium]
MYERDAFFKSLKRHGIKDMHHDKKVVLSDWIRNAKNEVCIVGYRLIITLDLIDDLICALNTNKGLNVKILACPPWTDTYKKIFEDDCSMNYAFILKKLKDSVPDFEQRISFRITSKPLFNDTYIVDHYIITSPYVHNKNKVNQKAGIITADRFFSLEIADDSNLFHFFKEDFVSVWESNETKDINLCFELFGSKEIGDRLTTCKTNTKE